MVSYRDLSVVLSEFARTMATDFPIQAILDRLVLRIVDVLPVTAAGVTLIFPGHDPYFVAASDDAALRFERLQSELAEGPCIEAYETGEAVAIPDLGDDGRFPAFGPRSHLAGLRAVFTFPLRHGDGRLGALDLYRDAPGPLDADAMVAAQTLADVTSAYVLNARSRADLREACDRLREASLHDDLTGLPNRTLFGQRLNVAIERARRSPTVAAVLFVDLNRFRAVNHTYGHHVGDRLLVAVAERLSGLLRPGDTLARLSGDEFILLCEGLRHRSQASTIEARIGAAFDTPFVLPEATITMTASVGIAFAGRGNEIPERLLVEADTAMYRAKRLGGASPQSAPSYGAADGGPAAHPAVPAAGPASV